MKTINLLNLQTRFNCDYQILWTVFEYAMASVRHAVSCVNRNRIYFLDGTSIALTQDSMRAYYINSGLLRDPDMMAR